MVGIDHPKACGRKFPLPTPEGRSSHLRDVTVEICKVGTLVGCGGARPVKCYGPASCLDIGGFTSLQLSSEVVALVCFGDSLAAVVFILLLLLRVYQC